MDNEGDTRPPIAGAAAVAVAFDTAAASYDSLRRKLVPCFDAFYGNVLEVIDAWDGPPAPSILDLGAGTGLLSEIILRHRPEARIHLVDVAEAMLAGARRRLAESLRVSFEVADYARTPLGGPWDMVVSALSIHHLADDDKRSLYRRAFDSIRPGGLFINAEQVLGPTAEAESHYRRRWSAEVLAAGVPPDEYARTLERMRLDRCAPLEVQLGWLREAGFAQVDCTFKQWCFAVISGIHPPKSQ